MSGCCCRKQTNHTLSFDNYHITRQAQHLVELEAEVRALKNKAQYAQEDEKAKWAELAKEKAAAATGARRVTDLEAQIASLNDMVELLTLDKEQLLIDKELLDERVEELGLEVETLKLELEYAEFTSAAHGGEGGASEASGGQDVQALAEQNGRLRAALKKLQVRHMPMYQRTALRPVIHSTDFMWSSLSTLYTGDLIARETRSTSKTARIGERNRQY